MKRRSTLLGVALLTIGLVLMPYTVALYSNQHDWQDGTNVDCTGCHDDITIPTTGMHSSLGTASDYCTACHQISSSSGEGTTGGGVYDDEHAAVTVECLDCHGDAYSGMEDVWYTSGDGGGKFINNETEGHHNMTGSSSNNQGAWASDLLVGNNEACIACHTQVSVSVSWTYEAYYLNISASEDLNGYWNVTFTATSGP
jgi:hypothetical protein